MENGNLPTQLNDKHLSSMHKSPLVFIGMPLYNEDVHLEEALGSILNQTYKNIKILHWIIALLTIHVIFVRNMLR